MPSTQGRSPEYPACVLSESASVSIHEDGSFAIPLGIVVGDPDAGCPFADIVSTGKNAGSLDVSNLDDIFVLTENIAELLTGCTMSHCAVDVF